MKKILAAAVLLGALLVSTRPAKAGVFVTAGPVFPVYPAPVAVPPPAIVRPAPIVIAPRPVVSYGRPFYGPRWRRW